MKKKYKIAIIIIIIILTSVLVFGLILNNLKQGKQNTEKKVINQEEINQLGDLHTNLSKYDAINGDISNENSSYLQVPTRYFVVERTDTNSKTASAFEYSPIYFSLPDDLKAKSDSEVNTLVKIVRSTSNTTDENDKTVKHENVEITVIDIPSSNIITQYQMNSVLPVHVTDSEISSSLVSLCGYNLGDLYNNIPTYAQVKPSSTEIRKANKPTKYFIVEKNKDISEKFTFSQINTSLPIELLATSSKELNTLVLLEYSKTNFGTYGNGASAYRLDLKITAYDMKTKRLINQGNLYGEPPSSIPNTTTGGATGTISYDEIVSYLEKLAGYIQ